MAMVFNSFSSLSLVPEAVFARRKLQSARTRDERRLAPERARPGDGDRAAVQDDPPDSVVLVLGDDQDAVGAAVPHVGEVQQQHHVGVLLELAAVAEVVHADVAPIVLLVQLRYRDLAQADHGDLEILGQTVQRHGDLGDRLVAVPGLRGNQLHIVHEDHVELPGDGLGPDVLHGVPGGFQDPEGQLLAPASGVHDAGDVLPAQALLLEGPEGDVRVVGGQAVGGVGEAGLVGEEAHALPGPRHTQGELQGQGRLAHGAVRADHHEAAGADHEALVQRRDAPVQPVRRRLVVLPVQQIGEQLPVAQIPVGLVLHQEGRRLAQQLPGPVQIRVRAHDLHAGGLDPAELGLVLQDPRVLQDVGRGGRLLHQLRQALPVVRAAQAGLHDHRVDGLTVQPELPEGLEDPALQGAGEVLRAEDVHDLRDAPCVDQHGAQHCFGGYHCSPGRDLSAGRSSPPSCSWNSSQRRLRSQRQA